MQIKEPQVVTSIAEDAGKIYVLDDDIICQKILKYFLSKENFTVTTLSTPEEAMRYFNEQGHPDILILDNLMPNIRDFEFLRILSQMGEREQFHIIVVAPEDFAEERERALSQGADSYFTKPYDIPKLIKEIKRLQSLSVNIQAASGDPC